MTGSGVTARNTAGAFRAPWIWHCLIQSSIPHIASSNIFKPTSLPLLSPASFTVTHLGHCCAKIIQCIKTKQNPAGYTRGYQNAHLLSCFWLMSLQPRLVVCAPFKDQDYDYDGRYSTVCLQPGSAQYVRGRVNPNPTMHGTMAAGWRHIEDRHQYHNTGLRYQWRIAPYHVTNILPPLTMHTTNVTHLYFYIFSQHAT
jgi:hypothetical protein